MQRLQLSKIQKDLHHKAVLAVAAYKKAEWHLVETLMQVDRQKLFLIFGYPSLFRYVTDELKLTESVAYMLISVARKSAEVPALKLADQSQSLSVSKASRIVSGLNKENAKELIDFACEHTSKEIDFEIARRNPRSTKKQSVRAENAEHVRLGVSVTHECLKKIERVQDLLAQKGRAYDLAGVIEAMVEHYLQRNDPVIKAKRILGKKAQTNYAEETKFQSDPEIVNSVPTDCFHPAQRGEVGESVSSQRKKKFVESSGSVHDKEASASAATKSKSEIQSSANSHKACEEEKLPVFTSQLGEEAVTTLRKQSCERISSRNRIPLTAEQKHEVFDRDSGQCTFLGIEGRRCESERFLQVHHIISVSQGGGNELDNLTTLCSAHH